MTTAQVVETSVTVNNNSPIQDYVHPDDQTQPTFEMTPEFKPFTAVTLFQHCNACYAKNRRCESSRVTSLLESTTATATATATTTATATATVAKT